MRDEKDYNFCHDKNMQYLLYLHFLILYQVSSSLGLRQLSARDIVIELLPSLNYILKYMSFNFDQIFHDSL